MVGGVESLHGRVSSASESCLPRSLRPPLDPDSYSSLARSVEQKAGQAHHLHRYCVLSMRGEIGSWYRRELEIDHGLLSSLRAFLLGAQSPPVCVYTVARTGLTEEQ